MAGSKEISHKGAAFAKGGKGHMFGKQVAGAQVPGGTAHKTSGGDSKFAAGGKTKMFGKQVAGTQVPGGTAHKTTGGDSKFAAGGSTKMFGFTPARQAKGGVSSSN